MPKVKLTKAIIDKIPHTSQGQMFLWDAELRGFGLCISRFSKTFVAQRDVNGRSRRVTLGRYGIITPDQARKLAMQNLFLMAQGINPTEEKRAKKSKSMTLRMRTIHVVIS